jgi:hypothetical protein
MHLFISLAATYKKGDRVVINAGTTKKPSYLKATITSVRSGKHHLLFDDGDKGASDDIADIVGPASETKHAASFGPKELSSHIKSSGAALKPAATQPKAKDDWWETFTYEEQAEYLKAHPRSRKIITKKKELPVDATVVHRGKRLPKVTILPIEDVPKSPTPKKEAPIKLRTKEDRILQELEAASSSQKEVFGRLPSRLRTVGMAKLVKMQGPVSDPILYKKWAADNNKGWNTSEDEQKALTFYTLDSNQVVNGTLRYGDAFVPDEDDDFDDEDDDFDDEDDEDAAPVLPMSERITHAIKHLDTAIQRATLKEDVMVFRGLKASKTMLADLLGKGITDKGFMSTSTSVSVAGDFTPEGDAGVVLAIRLPKGTSAAAMSAMECEMLLPRGTTIVPTKIEKLEDEDSPPRYIVHAEVVFPKQ